MSLANENVPTMLKERSCDVKRCCYDTACGNMTSHLSSSLVIVIGELYVRGTFPRLTFSDMLGSNDAPWQENPGLGPHNVVSDSPKTCSLESSETSSIVLGVFFSGKVQALILDVTQRDLGFPWPSCRPCIVY